MVKAVISPPKGQLDLLAQHEIDLLCQTDNRYTVLLRQCALAVLSTGNESDDAQQLLSRYCDFQITIITTPRGIKLQLKNAPENAFVDGKIIEGIRAHLFAVLRDIIFLQEQEKQQNTLSTTDSVFKKLRHTHVFKPAKKANIVVCWGGHSINAEEYRYSKKVGYRLGLRGMDICTGCGLGAMKAPMKGASIAHAKQRTRDPRYIGISEPEIIASEAPNAIVNKLIIMPDIEKRLEAFIRLGHAIVVFPGGAGTAEEILYILGVLLHKKIKISLCLYFSQGLNHPKITLMK